MMKLVLFVIGTIAFVKAYEKNDWTGQNLNKSFQTVPKASAYNGTGDSKTLNISQGHQETVRIVNGHQAYPNQFPYMAALFISHGVHERFCGGSLISERYVLTAAECLDGFVQYIDVLLGAHHYDQDESTQQRISAKGYRIHEDFSSSSHVNNIAVIELQTKAVVNSYVRVIALPTFADYFMNTVMITADQATFTGWGSISSNGDRSDTLTYMQAPVQNGKFCNLPAKVTPYKILCTKATDTNNNICLDDIGGPLVLRGKQIGIASHTTGNCQKSFFTRVSAYLKWISYYTDVKIKFL